MSSGKICPTAPISHDGLKAVPGRSRLCSFRNQVLPTGDSSCVYDGWPLQVVPLEFAAVVIRLPATTVFQGADFHE
jgi:hypothetical protein